jgi:hypothetical protein
MKIIDAKDMVKRADSTWEYHFKKQWEEIEDIIDDIMLKCMMAADDNCYKMTIYFPHDGFIKDTVMKLLKTSGYKVTFREEFRHDDSYLDISWKKGLFK